VTSTITEYSKNIDINFPPAGQALSTVKEFNMNFNKIEKSLDRASDEINQLQRELTKLTSSNDFGDNITKNLKLQNHSYSVNDIGLVQDTITNLDYRLGIYHKCRVANGTYAFNIINWPIDNRLAEIRFQLTNDLATTETSYISFSGNVQYLGYEAKTIQLSGNSSAFFDIFTPDSGETIYVKPLASSFITSGTYIGGGGTAPPPANAPVITYINPQQAGSSGLFVLSIIGENFGDAPQVIIYGNQSAQILSSSTTEISFYTLIGMPGSYQTVRVLTANGLSNESGYWIYDESGGGDGGGGGPE
jgi:hypothetical protein